MFYNQKLDLKKMFTFLVNILLKLKIIHGWMHPL